jgi:hypothetical protein
MLPGTGSAKPLAGTKDTWSRRQHPGAEYRLKFVKTNGAARRPARSLSDYRLAHAIAGIDPGRAFASDRNRAAHSGYYHAAYGARWAQRKPDPDHGRRSHVKLSAKGRKLSQVTRTAAHEVEKLATMGLPQQKWTSSSA